MTLADLEQAVQKLSQEELRAFSEWFAQLESQRWDDQLRLDAESGSLDRFADEALGEHRDHKARPL